jgi:hypothetical protein
MEQARLDAVTNQIKEQFGTGALRRASIQSESLRTL